MVTTELFSRPRPRADDRIRAALGIVNAMHPSDRVENQPRPADFPRVGRTLSLR